MRHIIALALIAGTSFVSFAAESKKEITARQIIGTWTSAEYEGNTHWEITRIYSTARKYYITVKYFDLAGKVQTTTEAGTYSLDDNGNLLEAAESSEPKPVIVVDWIDPNTFMFRIADKPFFKYKRSE
jgi:hypothetical protein